MSDADSGRAPVLVACAAAVLSAATYLQALGVGFYSDDLQWLTRMPATAERPWFVFTVFYRDFNPLLHASFFFDYLLGHQSAWAFHLSSIILHALNTALVAVLCARWTGSAVFALAAGGKSLVTIMTNLTNADYRIGTTGTLDGTKTNKLVLGGLFGSVNKVTSTKDLMDQGHVSDFEIKCLVLKHSTEIANLLKKATYQDEIKYLIQCKSRNRFIKNLALSLKTNTLVLFNYIEHGQILHKLINSDGANRKIFLVYGKTEAETREEIRHIVEQENDAIIIASYGVFSTGVNIKNLHNIIFASPSKSRIRNLQSIGRGLRLAENKTKAVLFDIADNISHKKHKNYTLEHFQERIRIYSEEKFAFRIYNIELKE